MAIQALSDLKALIESTIYNNTTHEIDGSDVQTALINAIDTLNSGEGFLNVHKANGQQTAVAYASKALARTAVPDDFHYEGVGIAYKLSTGWIIEQNVNAGSDSWTSDSSWITTGPISAVEDSSTGKTTIHIGDNSYDVVTSPIVEAQITDGAVTTNKIANSAVTEDKIASNAVTTVKIASGAVTTGKIDGKAVTTTKLDDEAVTTAKIADSNVTEAKLATDAVTTTKIKDKNVTTGKIDDSAVTTDKIATNAVTTAKILDGNVNTAKIADSAITISKIDSSVYATDNDIDALFA